MAKKYTQLPIEYLEPKFSSWQKVLGRGEVVNVMFYPMSDALFRAWQLRDWLADHGMSDVPVIDLHKEVVESAAEVGELLERVDVNHGVIIVARRMFLSPNASYLTSILEEYYAKGVGFVVMHDGFESELGKYNNQAVMSQHHDVVGFYPMEIGEKYLVNTAKLWKMKIDESVMREMAKYCGGVPWLMNVVLREHQKSPNKWRESESLWWKVELIWKEWAREYQDYLLYGSGSDVIKTDLVRANVVDENGEVKWPFLRDWLGRQKKNLFEVTVGARIIYLGRELTGEFSPSERRVLQVMSGSNEVVGKEKIARVFWQKDWEDKYSEWAIDQMMSRLRKKMSALDLPIKIITRRGKGYEWSQED